jgi:gluconokinase
MTQGDMLLQGVAGSGKSTMGLALSKALGDVPFLDGDDFHPEVNVNKMAAGIPLTDSDRMPWLKRLREHTQRVAVDEYQARQSDGEDQKWNVVVVVACSALRKTYRDYLRHGGADGLTDGSRVRTVFVFLNGSEDLLNARIAKRDGHFMGVQMLQSQLDTLEDPRGEEDVVVVAMDANGEEQVRQALEQLQEITGQ